MIQWAIQRLLDGHDLGRDEARAVMSEIMDGEATPAQISGFLVALRAKGETARLPAARKRCGRTCSP